jgi:hypothetical protein
MADRMQFPESDPRHHTPKIRRMLADAARNAREDGDKVTDLQARFLFETTAEILDGLLRATNHAERRSEPAWR